MTVQLRNLAGSNTGATAQSSISFSHTVAADANFLLVAVAIRTIGAEAASATFNGATMNLLMSNTNPTGAETSVFVFNLDAPPQGTTGTVLVTLNMAAYAAAESMDFSGVNLVSPIQGDFQSDQSDSATSGATTMVVGHHVGDLALSFLSKKGSGEVPAVDIYSQQIMTQATVNGTATNNVYQGIACTVMDTIDLPNCTMTWSWPTTARQYAIVSFALTAAVDASVHMVLNTRGETASSVTSLSVGFTIPSGFANYGLIAAIHVHAVSSAFNVTYNGVAMTQLQKITSSTYGVILWYWLPNPDVGASHSLAISWVTAGVASIWAAAFCNVDLSKGPYDLFGAGDAATWNTVSHAGTPVSGGLMYSVAWANGSTEQLRPTIDGMDIFSDVNGTTYIYGAACFRGNGGSFTMQWNRAGTARWGGALWLQLDPAPRTLPNFHAYWWN